MYAQVVSASTLEVELVEPCPVVLLTAIWWEKNKNWRQILQHTRGLSFTCAYTRNKILKAKKGYRVRDISVLVSQCMYRWLRPSYFFIHVKVFEMYLCSSTFDLCIPTSLSRLFYKHRSNLVICPERFEAIFFFLSELYIIQYRQILFL